MAPRRATYYSYGTDEQCRETMKMLEDAGVLLKIRDISKDPLSEYELRGLLGHLDLRHFINTVSPAFKKNKLDEKALDRVQVLKLMMADHTLIRRPIISTSRLTTVGCDRARLSQMLQLNSNGQPIDQANGNRTRGRSDKNERRQTSGSRK